MKRFVVGEGEGGFNSRQLDIDVTGGGVLVHPPPPGGCIDQSEGQQHSGYGIRFTRPLASGTGGPPKPHEPEEAPTGPAVGSTARVSG